MEKQLNIIRQTRANFIRLIEASSIEELNNVPVGFNNNMIWNFGHIIVSQQLLCYKLAGIEPKIDAQHVAAFSKGTKPERIINQTEVETLKDLMLSTIDVLEDDLKNKLFVNYQGFMTSYGVQLDSTEDAVLFFGVHDAFHYGCASSIKKAINNSK